MKFFSLKKKIYLILVIVLIAPTILLAVILDSITKKTLIEQIRDADLKTINTIKNSIENITAKLEQYGTHIAEDQDLNSFLKNAIDRAADDKSQYLNLNPGYVLDKYINKNTYKYISLISSDGYFIGEYSLNKDRLNLILNKLIFSQLKNNQPNWLKMYTIEDSLSKQELKVFPCLFPVNDSKTNENLGYAVLYLDERELFKTYSAYNGRIYMLNEDKKIISHQDQSILQKDYYRNTNIGYSYLLKNISTVVKIQESKVVLTTQELDILGWQMVMITSFNEYLPKGTFTSTYLYITMIISIMFAIVMGYVISYYISKPVLKLKATMQSVDKGDLSVRHKYKSNDEIGELSLKFNQMLDTIQNLMVKVLKEERLKQNYKMQLIQAQVNPHFLYNALEMINSLVRLDLKDYALEATSNISEFYRISLSDGINIIKIEQEIELANNFLSIYKMRYMEFIDFEIDVDPSTFKYSIPKLILQPIIENSICHGLRQCEHKGFIYIKGYLEDNYVVFELEDNGKGITEEKLGQILDNSNNTDSNFGITCIKDRLKLYFGEDISFNMESQVNKFTRTFLKFPCKLQ